MTATINGQVRRELASFQPSTTREKEEQDARNPKHLVAYDCWGTGGEGRRKRGEEGPGAVEETLGYLVAG
jgi:hypothetical protein